MKPQRNRIFQEKNTKSSCWINDARSIKNLPAGSMMPTMETNAVPKAESLDLTVVEGLETSSTWY